MGYLEPENKPHISIHIHIYIHTYIYIYIPCHKNLDSWNNDHPPGTCGLFAECDGNWNMENPWEWIDFREQ